MVQSDEKIREAAKRLLLSRMRVLLNNGFYGLLLMHMKFALDEECETAATDGERIYFSPTFMERVSDSEIDFVLMHEILHVALMHCLRKGERDNFLFNIACDIVVNSNILKANNNDIKSITLKEYGASMHLTPDGNEGCNYTAEEVYEMLMQQLGQKTGSGNTDTQGEGQGQKDGKGGKKGGGKAGQGQSQNEQDETDTDGDGQGNGKKQGGGKGQGDGDGQGEGQLGGGGKGGKGGRSGQGHEGDGKGAGFNDDHSKWGEVKDEALRDVWVKRVCDAAEAIEIQNAVTGRGTVPLFAKRLLKELKDPQLDWKTILNDFVQEEVCDYSFSPPDRRFGESPFFLPDFNDTDTIVSDVLFMIDTSGSMSDNMITAAYSEVKGAIDQFDGKLKGYLGFFDAAIVEPEPFKNEEEFKVIYPVGGGGTDFEIIFRYIRDHMSDKLPKSIIILTDGYAPFPEESAAMDIPVLWLLNNEEVTPPWGKVARIKVGD
ncbi:MAG: hypothetical protein IJC69_08235 [Clostridia bacterium]|nr:hypothetical protein [Clostridia bacterium]